MGVTRDNGCSSGAHGAVSSLRQPITPVLLHLRPIATTSRRAAGPNPYRQLCALFPLAREDGALREQTHAPHVHGIDGELELERAHEREDERF